MELPAKRTVVRLFLTDGHAAVGFWDGKQFMSSGSSVSAWGWQRLEPIDSFEASRLLAEAIGFSPSTMAGSNHPRDARIDKPRAFRVVRLRLPTGEELFGLWDGFHFLHQGHSVHPTEWEPVRIAA